MTMVKPNAGVILLFSNVMLLRKYLFQILLLCVCFLFFAPKAGQHFVDGGGGVVGESKIKKNSARSISKKSNDFVGKFMLE